MASVVGARCLTTFMSLWQMIRGWACWLYITDGYCVYPCLIDECDHLVSKTAMTRVEGENCRLRHYLPERTAKRCVIPSPLICCTSQYAYSSTISSTGGFLFCLNHSPLCNTFFSEGTKRLILSAISAFWASLKRLIFNYYIDISLRKKLLLTAVRSMLMTIRIAH